MFKAFIYYNENDKSLNILPEEKKEDGYILMSSSEGMDYKGIEEMVKYAIIYFDLGQRAGESNVNIDEEIGVLYLHDVGGLPFEERYEALNEEEKEMIQSFKDGSYIDKVVDIQQITNALKNSAYN